MRKSVLARPLRTTLAERCAPLTMIHIVSGLPRSGTSLMMQMLSAGGMPVLTDHRRAPDEDNPQGYLEWDPVKRLRQAPERIAEAEGKVVKVVSPLLNSLPAKYAYRVVFMLRPEEEILRSQGEMTKRAGTDSGRSPAELKRAYQQHLEQLFAWLDRQVHFQVLRVHYSNVVRDPRVDAVRVKHFFDADLDIEAMVRQVIPSLYRQRCQGEDPVGTRFSG